MVGQKGLSTIGVLWPKFGGAYAIITHWLANAVTAETLVELIVVVR